MQARHYARGTTRRRGKRVASYPAVGNRGRRVHTVRKTQIPARDRPVGGAPVGHDPALVAHAPLEVTPEDGFVLARVRPVDLVVAAHHAADPCAQSAHAHNVTQKQSGK